MSVDTYAVNCTIVLESGGEQALTLNKARGGAVSRSRITEGLESPNLGKYLKFSTAVKSKSRRIVRRRYVPSIVGVVQLQM